MSGQRSLRARSQHGQRISSDRGLATTEMAILMPFVLILVLVVTYAGQASRHESRTQAAADAAARSAAFFLTQADAETSATQVAQANCDGVATAVVDFDGREPAEFFPGWLRVDVTCTESFDQFIVFGGVSDRTAKASAVAVREFWREIP